MALGPNFGYGIQRLFDAEMRFLRCGHPVYLRLRNFDPDKGSLATQLGFAIAPSGVATGTTDTLIDPPAMYYAVSMSNFGQTAGKLRFGARMFQISHEFVRKQRQAQGYDKDTLVWRDPRVVGLVTDNKLYSIEEYYSHVIGGTTMYWRVAGNAIELK